MINKPTKKPHKWVETKTVQQDRKRRDNNNNYNNRTYKTNDAQCNYSPLSDQYPTPTQGAIASSQLHSSLYMKHNFIWYRIFL